MKNDDALYQQLTGDMDALARGLAIELLPDGDEAQLTRIRGAAQSLIEHIAAAAGGRVAHDPAPLRALARLADATSPHTAAHTARFLIPKLNEKNSGTRDLFRDTLGRLLMLDIEAMLPDPGRFFDTLARDSNDVFGEFTDIVYLVDIDGVVRYVNPAIKTVLGYDPDELIGRHSTEFIKPSMYEKVNAQLDRYRKGEVMRARNEYEVPHRDGGTRVLEISGAIIRDGGKAVGFQGVARDVTYRLELQSRLQQERDKLDAAITGIGAGLIVLDPEFNILWVNDRAYEWLPDGFEPVGKKCHEVFHGSDSVCDVCAVRDSMLSGKPVQVEKSPGAATKAAGDTFLFSAAPVRNEQGEIIQMIEMFQDVTTTRINAEKTRFWQEFYLKVVHNAPVGIVTLEPTGEVLTWNRYMENMYEIPAFDVIGKNIIDEFPSLAREQFDSWLRRVDETRQPLVILDWTHASRHKGNRIIDLMLYPLLDSNGDLLGMAYINSDVTERRRMQQELDQTRDLLARLFQSVTDYVFLIQPDGRISDANPAAADIFRFALDEIKNAPWSGFFNSPGEFDEFMREVLEKKRIDLMELELRDRLGAPRHVLQSATLLLGAGGEPEAIAVVGKDVTDMRLMQERMLRIQRLNALGELASGVAHDFNNLLAVILGRSQLLLKRAKDDNLRKSLEVIERAARHGSETIKRIQSFARKSADDENLDEVDINDIVNEAVEFTRTRWKNDAHARGISISMDFRPGAGCTVRGAAHELIEVFTNLILNAVDAMPHGGDLSIVTELRENHVLVSITDSGVGMPMDVKRRIFDPFFTTKGVKGTGLGLSISYGIVERHAGTIEVFSELGSGTTFWVRLPARDAADQTARPAPVPLGPRILVVEDDDDVLDLLVEILQSHNYSVTPARNGRDAVALIEQQRFDALFTDMRMPGVDGWDVIRAAHSRNPGILVTLVTGWASQVRKEDLAENRVHALIGKPFTENEILSVLENLGEEHVSEKND